MWGIEQKQQDGAFELVLSTITDEDAESGKIHEQFMSAGSGKRKSAQRDSSTILLWALKRILELSANFKIYQMLTERRADTQFFCIRGGKKVE